MSDQHINPEELQHINEEQNMPVEDFDQSRVNELRMNFQGEAVSIEQMGDDFELEEMERQREERVRQRLEEQREEERRVRAQENARRMQIIREIINDDAVIRFPKKTKLSGEFKSAFTSKVSDASRAKKQRNKRSRLFQKARNVEKFADIENRVIESNFTSLEALVGKDQDLCDKEELADLSAFMSQEEGLSQTVLNLYLGKGDYKQGTDRQKAMDNMLIMLNGFDLGNLDLANDKVLADHAKELETLSLRLCAFESLAGKNGYFANMDSETEKTVTEKLKVLRSVVTYYQCRKEVINDPLYATHYNEELTMDVTAAETPEQKALAEKLLKAHLAGVEMMKRNGADNKLVVSQYTPTYKNYREGTKIEDNIRENLRIDWEYEYISQRYKKGVKPFEKAEETRRNNDRMAQKFRDKAVFNMEHFEGDLHKQEGYEKTHYDPEKVMDHVNEMKSIKVSDIKFGSYRELIDNFAENYRICDRVSHLHSEITKAILYGYENENLKDADIMELRAIELCFNSIKNTLCIVNKALTSNKEAAKFSDSQWEDMIGKATVNMAHPSLPIFRTFLSNKDQMLQECKNLVEQEEAQKEENIKTAYRHLKGTKENPEISKDELEERKAFYQRNALVQDYMSNNPWMLNGTNTLSANYLSFLEKKHGKPFPLPRMKNLLVAGRSAAEVEKIYRLATGTPKEQFQFYMDLIKQYTDMDVNKFNGSDLGEYFENWDELILFSDAADGEMKMIADKVIDLMAQDGSLTLPEEYPTPEELREHTLFLYDLGQQVAPKTSGFMQMPSNKWLHAFSMKELGSFDKDQMDVMMQNGKALQLGEVQVDELELRTFQRLINSLGIVNMENPLKPGERIGYDTDMIAVYEYFKEEHKKNLADYKKRKEETSKLSQKESLIPVSPEQWKTYGGGTTEKIVTKEEGERLVKKSNKFLTLRKVEGSKDKVVLKPSMPARAKINGKMIDIRESYNIFVKAYIRLATNEDGTIKQDAADNDGLCERFDFLTALSADQSERNIAKAKSYLEETFKPEFIKIIEERSIKPDDTEENKAKARDKAAKKAQQMCDNILAMLTYDEKQFIPDEISLTRKVKEISYLMDTDEARLKEIAAGFKFKERKLENGQEVVIERNATDDEISAAIAEMKEEVREVFAGMKEVRDLDYESDVIPIPNTCSSNVLFTGYMQEMVTGKRPLYLYHDFDSYVLEHPEEVRLFLRKNLHLLQLKTCATDGEIERTKNKLDRLTFDKDQSFTFENRNEDVNALIVIAKGVLKFSYHVATNIVNDKEDGMITVEGMAATEDKYMVTPFTMKPVIGQYYGEQKPASGESMVHEGFSKFNNAIPPYGSDIKYYLKSRMKRFLVHSNGEGLR